MGQEDIGDEITQKGQAFIHYYYVDRGSEKDLEIEQAIEEFEAFIYSPIRRHVVDEVVDQVVAEAIEYTVPKGKRPEDLDQHDLTAVCHIIGLSFLSAYLDLHKLEDDES